VLKARWKALVALCLVAAGGMLIRSSQRQRRAADLSFASQLLRAFDSKKELTDDESSALVALAASPEGVRASFLGLALADDRSAARLGSHEHPLAVALSQVSRQDARRLFDDAIAPVIKRSEDSLALREAFHLVERWSLVPAMSADDRDVVASDIAARIVADVDSEVRNELLSGYHLWNGQLSVDAAERQAGEIVRRLLNESDVYTARSLTTALAVAAPLLTTATADTFTQRILSKVRNEPRREQVAPRLIALGLLAARSPPVAADDIAEEIVGRITQERDSAALPTWVSALEPLRSRVTGPRADKLAQALVDRIGTESTSGALYSLVTALNLFSEAVTKGQADRIVQMYAERFERTDSIGISAVAMGIEPLAGKVSLSVIGQVRALGMERLRHTKDSKVASPLGFSIGALPSRPSENDEAAGIVVSLLQNQQGTYEISTLDGALESLAMAGLDPNHAAQMAAIMADRMIREGSIPDLLRVAMGFQILAKQVPESAAGPLAARLRVRMQESGAPSVTRALAFAIGFLKAGAENEQRLAAAALKSRILTEQDPVAVRALTTGLLNLGEEVPQREFDQVATRLQKLIGMGLDDEDLTASLSAIRERTSEEIEEAPKAPPASEESIARQVLDPLCEESEWGRLALILAPPKEAPEKEQEDDEEFADFHNLIVADDDGESGTAPVESYSIDFNRLSDALDRFRPPHGSTNPIASSDAAGWSLIAAGLLLLIATWVTPRPSLYRHS
jgi:hypothetical protein